jgi:predicted PurR-regulated permease PerM
MPELRPQTKVAVLIAVLAAIATLYLAQDFLMPLALAILISFLLGPVVTLLERWRLGRIPAVLCTATVAFFAAGLVLYIVAGQLVDLAKSLPGYKDNLRAKAAAFRISGDSPITKIADTFREVSAEFDRPEPGAVPAAKPASAPMAVEVVGERTSALTMIKDASAALLGPLGTAAMIVVFVIFMLIERSDLRDRFIHLIGRGRLRITTQAIDEAATRVSRYLLAQLLVNVTYGIPIGVGLYFIGIPNAILWGLLSVVLRFVPYIGPWISAIFPIALSFAIAPGWWPPVATIGLFVVIELLSNNVVEPWAYGSSTGLSPMAIIVAAVFWTWLWGAGGLLLATPLTVCLAVLGKYVPSLGFLDLLLGDKPPIAPEQRFYQRLLAGDETELFAFVEEYTDRQEFAELFDQMIVPALRQGEQDYSSGTISREERQELFQRVRDALGSIDGFNFAEGGEFGACVIVPSRSEGDELAAHMMAFLLQKRGVRGSVVSHRSLASEVAARLGDGKNPWLCVSAVSPISGRNGEVLLRRLASSGGLRTILGLWGQLPDPAARARQAPEGTLVATLLHEAARAVAETAEREAEPATAAPALAVAEAGGKK